MLHVLRKAKESRVLRLRNCLRLLPCTHIVRSEVADVDAAAKAAVTMAIDCCAPFSPQPPTAVPLRGAGFAVYACVHSTRMCNSPAG